MAYLDQYYKNEGVIEYPKWNEEHLSFNGPDVLDNNRYEEAYLIQGGHLTELLESARFLDVDGTIYDFTAAKQLPSDLKVGLIDKVWYDRKDAKWYYTSTEAPNIPVPFTSIVNLYYGEKHDTDSEYHDFVATTTVDPTCTGQGYTDYECRYCGKEGRREYVPSLDGHLWGVYEHDKNTKETGSQHYQVCKREGCNATSSPVSCNFVDTSIEAGTRHTCNDCGYYYDESTPPTETFVYVYFQTVHPTDGGKQVNEGVKYNGDTGHWATLGKLKATTVVTAGEKDHLGAKVKAKDGFDYHSDNDRFNLSLITSWDELKEEEHGARGYAEEAPLNKKVWHLNGTVNVYKLSYDANLPAGVKADVTVPDPAYYLLGGKATVSTDAPKLQGYDFGGWYTERECKNKVENTVTVTGDTVLYAKWTSRAQPTADLVDNNIIIKHGVNGAPEHGNDDDTTAHFVNKDAKISYQATLDMKNLEFGANPEHEDAVSNIKQVMTFAGTNSLWEFMMGRDITMFAGSTVNLYVKFSEKLDTRNIDWSKLSLTSDWFQLADGYQDALLAPDGNGYWKIPCVIKGEKGTGNSSEITLSGVSLSLTDQAQGELSSGKDLDVVSEGYIDGTIKITIKIYEPEAYALSPIGYTSHTRELSLIGRSKEAPAKNTAKLKLATYTVTYDANGGSGTMTDTNSPYAYEVVAKVLTNGFTRSRYTFTGWNTKADGSGKPYAEGDSIKMRDNVTLYAQWTRNSSHDDDDSKTYYYFAIQKVDAQDDHALNGAKFKLYLDGKQVATATSNRSGIAMFRVNESDYGKINAKSNLYYQELTAPEGYVVNSDEVSIKKNNLTTSWSKAEKDAERVRNYRGTTPDLLNGDDHFAYVVGYQDGCVHPNALITRAETATIFFRLLKDSVRDGNLLTSNTFADVPNAYWANTAISTMAGLGIVQGYNSTAFDPNASITRAEFAAICARFDTGKSSGTQTFTDIKGHWAEKYIERAAELGWIKGFEDGTFRPNDCITRAQAMTMINRVLNRIPEDASDLLSNMNVWPDCNPGDWFYLAVQEATNSHDFKHKAGNYETWTGMKQDPDWTRYEN